MEKKREVIICEGKLSFRGLAPLSPKQGPPIPRILACALAGTALAGVLIVAPGEMVRKSPPQVAYETVVATRATVAEKIGVTLPPAPPAPPEALMTENVTATDILPSGAVRASFTVVSK